MHLLLVGVRMENGRNVVEAEQLRRMGAELQARNRAFEKIELEAYGPLAADRVEPGYIRLAIGRMEAAIRQRQGAERPNDVLVIYYQGREVMDDRGQFWLTDCRNWVDPLQYEDSIQSEWLANRLGRIPGAHLLLLDVEHSAETSPRWPRFPRLGVFRTVRSPADAIPDDARLITVVQQAMSRAGERTNSSEVTLKPLEEELQNVYQVVERSGVFDSFVPSSLETLVLDRLPESAQ